MKFLVQTPFLLGHESGRPNGDGDLTSVFEGKLNVGRGIFSIGTVVHEGRDHTDENHAWIDRVSHFEVINDHKYLFDGVAKVDGKFI